MAAGGASRTISFVHEGLGNSSYLLDVGSGQAVVVDPDRRAGRYVAAAEEAGLRIAAVLETHLHADFVTGALEIGSMTGATVHASAQAGLAWPHEPVEEGAKVSIGDTEIEVRATPGHTPEHVSYVARTSAPPPLVFSGGALIVGGAARTDLISAGMTDPLTRALFATRRAFDDLPDDAVLLPTHGGGSFCSVGSGAQRTSTLRRERRANPVLTFPGDEDGFVSWFPESFPAVPAYYRRMRPLNAAGPVPASKVDRPRALDAFAFASRAGETGALVVDVRPPDAYAEAHVPGALAIPFRDSFCVWLGWLAPENALLLFVTDGAEVDEVVEESMLVGHERFDGLLDGGIDSWAAAGFPVATTRRLAPEEAAARAAAGATVLDVREPDEVARGAFGGALAIPLGGLASRAPSEIPRNRPVVAYCGHGERSTTAVSVLEREGYTALADVIGGYEALARSAGQVTA